MLKRLLRGSSNRGSKGEENEENEKPKYILPRTAEVRPCEWPCDAFLRATGIYDDFYYLAENVGLATSSTTSANSISYSLIFLCKFFISMLRNHHLQWSFTYMMRLRRCL